MICKTGFFNSAAKRTDLRFSRQNYFRKSRPVIYWLLRVNRRLIGQRVRAVPQSKNQSRVTTPDSQGVTHVVEQSCTQLRATSFNRLHCCLPYENRLPDAAPPLARAHLSHRLPQSLHPSTDNRPRCPFRPSHCAHPPHGHPKISQQEC